MDAKSTHHELRHIHSCKLLNTATTFSIALFVRKVSSKHRAMGDVRPHIGGQKHKNCTQNLQNQPKIRGENSPQLHQKVSFLQV